MKYFKHDSDARTDAKIKKVMLKYGLTGYGLYFFVLELIAQNVEKHNLTFELEHDSELIAADTGLHADVVQEMMTYFVRLKLFAQDQGIISCPKLATRTDDYTQKVMRSLGNVRTLSGDSPDTLRIKSGLKEEKRREEKRRDKPNFVRPTLNQIGDYCKERNNNIDPERFFDYHEANGWTVSGGRKMKCWKATIRNWERMDKHKEVDNEFEGI